MLSRAPTNQEERRTWPRKSLCGFGIDVDAVAGWLGSYGGEDSPDDISRGLFAGEVGSPRLLKMFERLGIKTTWFIPGHSIETFPEGDEGGGRRRPRDRHPRLQPREPDRHDAASRKTEILDKCIELVTQLSGKRPTGYVAPWWEFSPVTNELLLERGIKYDHSLMHNDHTPYYVRVGDSWTKIDYAKKPGEWMVPLKRGQETDLIEIPASWYLDDLPPMMFIKKSPNSHGFVNPRDIEEMWRDQFDWVYREYDYAVFPMTIHPDVSGRPHVLMMLERLYRLHDRPSRREVRHHERDGRRLRQALPAQEVSRRLMCALCGVLGGAGALDRRRRAAGRLHPQRRSAASAGASGINRVACAQRVLGFYGLTLSDWQAHVVRPVDRHRQDRDRRQPHAPLVGGREADRPAVRSARSGADRAAGGGR